jgi:hypothetical protein
MPKNDIHLEQSPKLEKQLTARNTIDLILISPLLLPLPSSFLDIYDLGQQQQHVEKHLLSLFLISYLFLLSLALFFLGLCWSETFSSLLLILIIRS